MDQFQSLDVYLSQNQLSLPRTNKEFDMGSILVSICSI